MRRILIVHSTPNKVNFDSLFHTLKREVHNTLTTWTSQAVFTVVCCTSNNETLVLRPNKFRPNKAKFNTIIQKKYAGFNYFTTKHISQYLALT